MGTFSDSARLLKRVLSSKVHLILVTPEWSPSPAGSPENVPAICMQATLKRRIQRLEDRSGPDSSKPRKELRIVVTCLDRESGLENAGCIRTLCPDGTLLETVRLDLSDEGHEELSEEALARLVESFPVLNLGDENSLAA
jgi:hypothetical protein